MSHPLTANLVMQKARADRPSMVRRLNVSGAQVNDIAVLEQFKHLEVCSLSANDVSDLAPLSHCDGLRELYLRKNDICDLFQVLHLRRLRDLQILTLSENPVSAHDCYRRYVIAVLPHLHKLDDIEVTHEERAAAAHEFPDVTVCDVPMPLPTKREVLESRSLHGSPNQRPARATSGSFDPPASARGRPAAAMGVRSNVTPPAQETPTPRDDSFSDFPGDDSGADAPLPAQRTSANNYDDRPVGSNRLNAPRQRAQHHAAAAGHRDPANDSSNDAVVAPPRHHHQADRATARQAPQVAASRPAQQQRSSALNAPHLGIREENVVRAINLLLSELSPAGLEAVRRQLDICC